MTRKIYKSAMGKTVDLGALLLQNEQVRAVGNMNINARGDVVDSNNKVVDQKNRQVQRHYRKQTNVSDTPVVTGTVAARQINQPIQEITDIPQDAFEDLPMDEEKFVASTEPLSTETKTETRGGLAAAIARSREVKQELDKTRRQTAQQTLKKI